MAGRRRHPAVVSGAGVSAWRLYRDGLQLRNSLHQSSEFSERQREVGGLRFSRRVYEACRWRQVGEGAPARAANSAIRGSRHRGLPRVRCGLQVQTDGSLPRRSESRVCADVVTPFRPTQFGIWERIVGFRGAGLRKYVRVCAGHDHDSPAASHASSGDPRMSDRCRGGAGRRRNLYRQVRPREGAVPLGPRRQEEREQFLLGAGFISLGREVMGRNSHTAHWSGGHCRLHRRRPGPSDHHGPHLQRRHKCRRGICRAR